MGQGRARATSKLVLPLLLVGLFLPGANALAQGSAPAFAVHCPATDSCLPPSGKARIEEMAQDAWMRFAALGFPSPLPQVKHALDASGRAVVPIEFCDSDNPASSARCRARQASIDTLAWVHNPVCMPDGGWPLQTTTIYVRSSIASAPDTKAYYLLAHEIFHLFSLRATVAGRHLCADVVPDWMTEGTAVFGGFWAMEQRFGPGAFSPLPGAAGARSYYGIRPYHLPLTLDRGDYAYANQTTSTSLSYPTSSLWRYLAERFHDASPRYLADYLAIAPAGCAAATPSDAHCRSDGAWLTWLDRQLRGDARIGRPLQEIYPEFLTEFATWAPRRFLSLDEAGWHETAFDGCREVTLSPTALEKTLELQARMYAGTCVKVSVSDLPDDGRAIVQFIAEDAQDPGAPIWVEGTRVGVADYGAPLVDPVRLSNCFEIRAAGAGQDSCLLDGHPRTERGSEAGSARRVNIFRAHEQKASGAAFTNTFVVTQTYRAPGSKESNEATRNMRLHIGLLTDRAAMAGTTSAVDAPVRIELDLVNVAQAASDQTPKAREFAGESACTFVLHAKKRSTRETVWLQLTGPGPISPGRYAIQEADYSQQVPGNVVTHFAVRAGDGNTMIEFRGVAGHLDITSITRSGAIAGVATIMGKRTTSRKKIGGPDALAIQATFTATVRDPYRRVAAIQQPNSESDPVGSDCLVAR